MQVTLNQSEIETGIRLYLDTQFKINDGQDITIELKAGRGPEGYTATIDIVPAGSGTSVKTPEPTPPTKPVTIPRVRGTTSGPVPDAPETAQETAGEAPPETATSGGAEPETASDSAGSGEAQASDGSGEAAVPPEGGEKPKSLFANLGKPKN